jgi:hypothetical protein
MSMNADFDRERLSKWLVRIATSEQEEVDCDELSEMLESIVAAGTSDRDIHEALPEIALHLDHCPDCNEWYEALLDLWKLES